MDNLLFNEKGRLRSGWRFTFFIAAFLVLSTVFIAIALVILNALPFGYEENSLLSFSLQSSIGLILAIILGWFCGKIFEELPFRALGAWFTKFWLKDFIIGFLLGVVSITAAVLIAMSFGNLSFQLNQNAGTSAIQTTLIVSLIIFIIGAAFEEVLVRGYIFQTFVRANYTWLAILVTSIFFAAGHLANPNAEIFSSINTGLAGVWLAVAYLKTRTLWLPFGLHLSWNWFQGSIFGIEVSGLTNLATAPVFTEIDTGPSWITGGDYGIEGGIACTAALILSTVFIWFVPLLKPTEEMLELSSVEKPVNLKTSKLFD